MLQRFTDGQRSWWICPGGGLDPGEDVRAGAIREMREELGLEDVALGEEIWRRRHEFEWRGQNLDQRERFFVLRVTDRFEPNPAIGAEQLAAEGVCEHRWWTIDEIEAFSADGVVFAPGELGELLRKLVRDGTPAEPIEVGI